MGTISERAVAKVAGPSWDGLRSHFQTIVQTLLSADPNSAGDLTTIYIKFTVGSLADSPVYAVVWVKSSKQLTVGLALPEGLYEEPLGSAPKGMTYKGITAYFTVTPADKVPPKLTLWSALAYRHVAKDAMHRSAGSGEQSATPRKRQ